MTSVCRFFSGFQRSAKFGGQIACCEYVPVVNVFTVYGQLTTTFCSLLIILFCNFQVHLAAGSTDSFISIYSTDKKR